MIKLKLNSFINFGLWVVIGSVGDIAISDTFRDYKGEGFTSNGIPVSEIICIERERFHYGEGDNGQICIDGKNCTQGNSLKDCLTGYPCFKCYSDSGCYNEMRKSGSSEVRFRKNGTFLWKTNNKLFNGDYESFEGSYVSQTFSGAVTLFLKGDFSHAIFTFKASDRFAPRSASLLLGVNVTYWQCVWK